ncbi:NRAMP metal ion transporter family protein [Actinidia rufa]|uniref:NRAMP metal ion transporter family protein n=1 Tax=Actinidia rufa TaxID=165716 RepID=A0A7J0G8A7_9ERIC|nr:NRAMP metal ion transporter family protein [Actinidia rufa]
MVGSGAGSLSRLAGLGCATRCQLTVVLDDFWGQLFDFHGQAIQEAKATRLDVLLEVDSKFDPKPTTPLKVDASVKEFTGYFPSIGGKGSDSPMNSKVYAENSNHNAFDAGERRYSSLRLPPSSESIDYHPATVHDYQIASYLSLSDRNAQWDGTIRYGTSSHSSNSLKVGSPLAFDNLSPPKPYSDPLTLFSSRSNTGSLWSKQSFKQFGLSDKIRSDWLFRQNDGADEDLIDRVTAKERFLYEAEAREMNRLVHMVEPQYSLDRKPGHTREAIIIMVIRERRHTVKRKKRRVFIHLAGNLKSLVLVIVAAAAVVVTAASAHRRRRELGQNLPEVSTKLSNGVFACGKIRVFVNGPIKPKSPCG